MISLTPNILEIADVAGDQNQVMDDCGRSDQPLTSQQVSRTFAIRTVTNVNCSNSDASHPLTFHFHGMDAVFSDRLGLYAFNVSGGTLTAVGS